MEGKKKREFKKKLEKQGGIEKDLKFCMSYRYFSGKSNGCLKNTCEVYPERKSQEVNKEDMCFQCPYSINNQKCVGFCMKKIVNKDKERRQGTNV